MSNLKKLCTAFATSCFVIFSELVIRASSFFSFRAQGDHGIDAGGAASREPGGKQRRGGEQHRRDREGNRIQGANLVEQTAYYFTGSDCEQQTEDESNSEHDRSFAEKHPLNRSGSRSQRHPDADLPGATCNSIGSYTVNAHDGETECETTKDGKERRSCAYQPEIGIALDVLRERLERKHSQRGINRAHGATEDIRSGRFRPGRKDIELDDEENVALKTARERQINRTTAIFEFEQLVPRRGNDAYDLD